MATYVLCMSFPRRLLFFIITFLMNLPNFPFIENRYLSIYRPMWLTQQGKSYPRVSLVPYILAFLKTPTDLMPFGFWTHGDSSDELVYGGKVAENKRQNGLYPLVRIRKKALKMDSSIGSLLAGKFWTCTVAKHHFWVNGQSYSNKDENTFSQAPISNVLHIRYLPSNPLQ